VQRALAVAGDDGAGRRTAGGEQAIACDIRRADSDQRELDLRESLSHHRKGVEQSGKQGGRGSLLVVVPDRDAHAGA